MIRVRPAENGFAEGDLLSFLFSMPPIVFPYSSWVSPLARLVNFDRVVACGTFLAVIGCNVGNR